MALVQVELLCILVSRAAKRENETLAVFVCFPFRSAAPRERGKTAEYEPACQHQNDGSRMPVAVGVEVRDAEPIAAAAGEEGEFAAAKLRE
jgi:hypothetical protein